MVEQVNLKNDAPIQSEADDKFGWSAYAKKVAETIRSVDAEDSSFVASLQGPWGAGKTSFLKLVENELSVQDDHIDTAWFNPWFFQCERDLLLSFFQLLATKTQFGSKNKTKKVVEKLKEYSYTLAGASNELIPVLLGLLGADPAVAATAEVAGSFAGRLFPVRNESKKSEVCLADLKADLDIDLCKQERTLVVFIDDLDRLSSEEIRLVFKIVTLTASFPKVVYILSFDRSVVSKALGEVQGFDGNLYLEKIVQLPIDLPSLSRKKVREKVDSLFEGLNRDGSFRYSKNDSSKLEAIGLNLVVPLLNTPRRLVRFENALALKQLHVGGEISPIDLLGMVSIQLFFPELFEWIKQNALFLCDGGRSILRYPEDVTKEKLNELKGLAGGECVSNNEVTEAICTLFPRLGGADHHSTIGGSSKSKRAAGKICSFDLFQLYIGYEECQGLNHRELQDVAFRLGKGQLTQYLDRELEHGDIVDVIFMIEDNIELLTDERACLLAASLAGYLGKCRGRGFLEQIGFDRAYLRLMTKFSRKFDKENLSNSLLSAFEDFDDENWRGFAFILRCEAGDREKGDKDGWMSDKGFEKFSRRYIELIQGRVDKALASGYFTELGAWRDAEKVIGGGTYKSFLASLEDNRPRLVLYEAGRLAEWSSGSACGFGLSETPSEAPRVTLEDVVLLMKDKEYLSVSALAQVKVAALSLLLDESQEGYFGDDCVSKENAVNLANETRKNLGAKPLEESLDGQW